MMPTKMECFKLALCFLFFWLKPLSANKPNIIIILADDLGWNDVGFHGSDEIPTPNIDALAYNGIVLNRHYVLPTCTPSRAALMTGKYPIRTGLQGDPGRSQQASGLPLKEKILPQYLKEQGYKTHLIGKWHLGFYQTAYTPTKRGFDSHFGYYNGWIRYNDSVVSSYPFVGKDARRNLQPAGDEFVGKYATDVFTDEAVKIIKRHDQTSPLFLEISQPAVHAVREDILQVRNEEQNEKDFAYIEDKQRRLLAGVIQPLDETVARVVEALHETGMLNNSVILFMSDNGGATEDPHWRFRNVASNWPLRGMKTSLHEGGVRGVAAIWSPLFKNKGYVSNDLFHMSDWLPTFVAAAGGNLTDLKDIDGVNQWELLVGNKNHSERQVVLVNINTLRNNSALIFMKWKLISNNETFRPTFADKYAGASGRNLSRSYDIAGVLASTTNKLISTISGKVPEDMKDLFLSVRSNATIDSNCKLRIANILSSTDAERCRRKCLYNLETDPCEVENIIDSFPDVVSDLENKLKKFESESLPIDRGKNDYRADPKNWGGYWSPWLDHEARSNTSSTIIREVLIIGITFILCRKIVRVLTIVM